MAISADFDRRIEAYLARIAGADYHDRGPVVVERCRFCSFVIEAPLAEARAAWAEHDCDRPPVEPSGQRRSGFAIRR